MGHRNQHTLGWLKIGSSSNIFFFPSFFVRNDSSVFFRSRWEFLGILPEIFFDVKIPTTKKQVKSKGFGSIFDVTPLKTNMEPENVPLGKEMHLQTINFGVPC